MGVNLLFGQNLPKTAWRMKKKGPRGASSKFYYVDPLLGVLAITFGHCMKLKTIGSVNKLIYFIYIFCCNDFFFFPHVAAVSYDNDCWVQRENCVGIESVSVRGDSHLDNRARNIHSRLSWMIGNRFIRVKILSAAWRCTSGTGTTGLRRFVNFCVVKLNTGALDWPHTQSLKLGLITNPHLAKTT